MKRIVGLDLGSNSVGWSIIEEKNEQFQQIIDAGSRIIPMGDEKTNFEQGGTASKNADRRQKRGARRLNHRYKLRRKNLLTALRKMGVSTDQLGTIPEKGSGQLTDEEFYEKRAKAVTDKLDSLNELGLILFKLNQRRGYQSNRKERSDENNSKTEVYNVRTVIQDVKAIDEKKRGKQVYEVKLEDEESIGQTTDDYFTALIGTEKEVQVKKWANKNGEESCEMTIPDPEAWQQRLSSMDREFEQSGLHPGQYFHKKIQEAKKEGKDFRVRQNLVFRKRYIDEFNAIWDEQEKYYPILQDEAIRNGIVNAVLPKNYPERKKWLNKPLKEFVRDFIIFYQRPLKVKKGEVDQCQFEPWKNVAPKSHPVYQEYKIWGIVNNLKVEDDTGNTHDLSDEQRVEMYQELNRKKSIKRDSAERILKLSKGWSLRAPDELSGNTTLLAIKKAFTNANEIIDHYLNFEKDLEKLWHILYSLNEEQEVKNAIQNNFQINSFELLKELNKVVFEPKWGNVSTRAMKRMLPLMRVGEYYSPEELYQPVKTNIEKILNGEYDELIKQSTYEHFLNKRKFGNVEDFNGLKYWEAATLVYGDFRTQIDEKYFNPEDIEILKPNSLRNPVVEQVVNETLNVIADIWRKYGKPDEIRIEFARELRQNAEERKKTSQRIRQRQNERDKARETIIKDPDFGISRPSRKDIDRYLLWEEANFYCIYSAKSIPKAALFNGETDIDHIIPRQRFFDDSFANKVICYRSANADKGNLTAQEFMKDNDRERFEKDVKDRFKGKKKYYLLTSEIPESFLQRQMNETRYITRKVREELQKIEKCEVNITSGTVTDYLKNIWGLNEVFKQLVRPRFERMESIVYDGKKPFVNERKENGKTILDLEGYDKRIDHRHHALDAIVTAATKQGMIQTLNNLNQKYKNDEWKERSPRQFKLPHPQFRDMVQDMLEAIIVSHKAKNKLVKHAVNYYSKRDDQTGKIETFKQNDKPYYALRAKLHDEQPYGVSKVFKKIKVKDAFEQVENLKEDWQKEKVEQRLAEFDGDFAKAKKSLNQNPLTDNAGEKLEKVTVFEEKFTKRYPLKDFVYKSPKALEDIADVGLKKQIKSHVEQFGGLTKEAMKEAFTDKNIELFNQSRNKPVENVKLLINGDLTRFETNEDPNDKKFIDGKNYCFIVYENGNGERSFDVISRYEALQMILGGEDVADNQTAHNHFTL